MTASPASHLLRVVADVPSDVPSDNGRPAVRDGRVPVTAATIAALTMVLTLLGGQAWQLPHRDGGGVSDVPQSLLSFLLLCTAGCLWAAGRVVQPAQTFCSADTARVWWLVLCGAAVVSIAAALSLASYSGGEPGLLALRCAVPVVPAVLAGLLARDDGRPARLRAALGTGIVTVPMTAVGWALLASPTAIPAGPADVLGMTVLAALVPLTLAVAFVSADRRDRVPAGA